MKEQFKTSIGGQAVIEGVMMRGPKTSALAVRKPEGDIFVEEWENPEQKWYNKVPFLRGVFNMVSSMILGYKCLMRSAEIAGMEEDEPSKFEVWLSDKLGIGLMTIVAVVAVLLGVGLSLFLFVVLPTTIASFLTPAAGHPVLRSLIEGIIKIGIFIAYILLVSKMPDIHRVFQYHGAEHKTIACYEAGLPLTVENIRPQVRFHPRCGTSFILIVLVISILLFSVVKVETLALRMLLKVVLLPVVVGLSYEIIRFAGQHNNPLTRGVSAPGLWLQRLTTSEPTDEQIQVAIESMLPAIPTEEGADSWGHEHLSQGV